MQIPYLDVGWFDTDDRCWGIGTVCSRPRRCLPICVFSLEPSLSGEKKADARLPATQRFNKSPFWSPCPTQLLLQLRQGLKLNLHTSSEPFWHSLGWGKGLLFPRGYFKIEVAHVVVLEQLDFQRDSRSTGNIHLGLNRINPIKSPAPCNSASQRPPITGFLPPPTASGLEVQLLTWVLNSRTAI